MAEEKQDGQKTLVAFVVGLLIGGMLVWAFSGPSANAPDGDMKDDSSAEVVESETVTVPNTDNTGGTTDQEVMKELPVLEVGDGSVNVEDQEASASVKLESAVYPVSEGWIGVREYNDGKLGYILGVVRFSESYGLVPSEIILQRSTTPDRQYAVVIFTEDGDYDFSLAGDVQIDKIFDTFTAK
ncbi:hypothetical protein H6785_03305 [Candidatus Nomurabacteria bacterium]|nr:hypothetical protein [Candidatus Kaiserbacteria bacterium]MCB9815575.1 hypothetical protein [Candidatus Nomurabacteria bacterium]